MKLDIKTKYIKDNQGLNHFSVKNYNYSFDYGDRVSFELANLFKESKELSKYRRIIKVKWLYFVDTNADFSIFVFEMEDAVVAILFI